MANIDPNKELDEFFDDTDKSKSKNLRLLLDELPMSDYDIGTLKLSDIDPVYFKRSVFVVNPSTKESRNKLF